MITNRPFAGFVIALCAIAAVRVGASEALSVRESVEIALRCNPAIAASQLSADAARHAARGARAITNPEIIIAPTIAGSAGSDSAVVLSQPLELNGARSARREVALNESKAAQFGASAYKRDIVLSVTQSYWETVRAQQVVELSQANLEYLESLRAAVKKQLDVGAVPGSQLIKMEVELARGRQDLAAAQLDLSLAKAALSGLLSRPKNTDFVASDPLTFVEQGVNREAKLSTALMRRPEIGAAQAEAEGARGGVRSARLRRAPDLALQARRGSFDSDSDQGVALAISLPVMDWGSVKAGVKQAEALVRSREKHLEAVRNDVSIDVEQALRQVETSSLVVREYQSGILEKSEELARMARVGYEKGATSYLEVLEAQRTLRSVKTAYYTALADQAKSIAQLEWAAGDDTTMGPTEGKK
jgi:cobalt-zinc-cadmium efflux system outer membrane protein